MSPVRRATGYSHIPEPASVRRIPILDGYQATIHWQELAIFKETFHNVDALTDRFVIDRNRITAGGATTPLDLMLHLIRKRHREALRLEVAALFIYDGTHVPAGPQRPPPPMGSLTYPADIGPPQNVRSNGLVYIC